MKDFLIGNRPLWQAFWLLFVGGFIALNISLGLLVENLYTPEGKGVLDYVVSATLIGYVVFSLISIWNCSKNSNKNVWYWGARIWVIWIAMVTVYKMVLRVMENI